MLTHHHYDGERNLIGLTNEKGERYTLNYDLNERLIEEIGFDGRVQRYQYNTAGHLIASDVFASDGKTRNHACAMTISEVKYTVRVVNVPAGAK